MLSWTGSVGGVPAAVPLAVQRYAECEVLPGDHVVFRTPAVEPPLQGPEERGQNGDGQGEVSMSVYCCTVFMM